MTRTDYYEQLKRLARDTRERFHFSTPRVLRSDLRRIYRQEGIRIDLWPHKFKRLRGAYFDDGLGPTVLLAKGLPENPMVFTMAHELKHHFADRGLTMSYCDPSNQSTVIEIGAEVFAAELIYPDADFAEHLRAMGIQLQQCTPEVLVRLKHETRTTLSYSGLAKRAEFMRFAPPGSLTGVKWKKLEENIYGPPIYKRFLAQRRK